MGFFSKIKDAIVGNSAKQNDKYVAGLDKSSSSFSAKINELAARYREIDDDYLVGWYKEQQKKIELP